MAVLLKNDGDMLPLDPMTAGSVVIIGQPDYVDDACQGGGGSSKVTPLYTVKPVEGMQEVLAGLGSDATVSKVTVTPDPRDQPAHRRRAEGQLPGPHAMA